MATLTNLPHMLMGFRYSQNATVHKLMLHEVR
jgi:hypothetical protein